MHRLRFIFVPLCAFVLALPLTAQDSTPADGPDPGADPERQTRILREPGNELRHAVGFDLPRLLSLTAGFSYEQLFGETFSGRAYVSGGRPDPDVDIAGPNLDMDENAFLLTGSAGARWYLNRMFSGFPLRPLDGPFVGGGFTLAYEQGDVGFDLGASRSGFTYSGIFFGPYFEAGFKWVTPWVQGLFVEPALSGHLLFGSFGTDWDGAELPDSDVDIGGPGGLVFSLTVGYAF